MRVWWLGSCTGRPSNTKREKNVEIILKVFRAALVTCGFWACAKGQPALDTLNFSEKNEYFDFRGTLILKDSSLLDVYLFVKNISGEDVILPASGEIPLFQIFHRNERSAYIEMMIGNLHLAPIDPFEYKEKGGFTIVGKEEVLEIRNGYHIEKVEQISGCEIVVSHTTLGKLMAEDKEICIHGKSFSDAFQFFAQTATYSTVSDYGFDEYMNFGRKGKVFYPVEVEDQTN